MARYEFKNVTLLVTHYNRSKSLEHLLTRCAEEGLFFEDTVVSDDGSRPEHFNHVKALQEKFGFRLVSTEQNKGLGNNINKGQDAVKTLYTLYIQEDFEPTATFAPHFADALQIIETENWDLIRFYTFPWAPFPYLKPYKSGYSEMLFKPQLWYLNHLKFRLYSDHPHLRKSNYFQKFGRYAEGKSGDRTEYEMCMQFLSGGGKALFFEANDLLLHENGGLEPNTMVREKWKLSNALPVRLLRSIYLYGKVVSSTIKLNKMKS